MWGILSNPKDIDLKSESVVEDFLMELANRAAEAIEEAAEATFEFHSVTVETIDDAAEFFRQLGEWTIASSLRMENVEGQELLEVIGALHRVGRFFE